MPPDPHQALIESANYFNRAARTQLSQNDQFHPETVILALARTAGSLMYRSFGFDPGTAPGTTVLSDQANTEGPKLMNVMFATLQQLGSEVGQDELDNDYASPRRAQLNFQASLERLAPVFLDYATRNAVPLEVAALGAAMATAMTVHDCRSVLAVGKGSALAVYGFVEGTKTAPFPIAPDATSAQTPARPEDTARPWYKFW